MSEIGIPAQEIRSVSLSPRPGNWKAVPTGVLPPKSYLWGKRLQPDFR